MTIIRLSDSPLNLAGFAPPCSQCGRPITVAVPADLLFCDFDPANKRSIVRLQFRPGYGDPDLCPAGRLESIAAGERARVQSEYEELLCEAAGEGMPAGMLCPLYTAFNDHGLDAAWHGWRVRVLALQALGLPAPLADNPGLDAMWGVLPDGTAFELLIYQTALWNVSIPAAGLVFHSGPNRSAPELEMRNWRDVERISDLERLMQGVRLYRALRPAPGRPRGGTTWPKDEFLKELQKARRL